MNYYPPLLQLIGREALPSDVGLLGDIGQTIADALDTLLSGIRFKDLVVNQAASGDARFYSLSIVSKQIGFKLPGTDITFLIFPGADGSGLANIPVAFEWRWGVKRYVGDFEAALFSRSPRDFFDLLLKVANISETQFISGIVGTFVVDPNPYLKLVQDIRASIADYQNGQFSLDDADGEIGANAGAILTGLDALIANLQDPAATFDSELDFIGDSLRDLGNALDIDLNVCLLAFETIARDVLTVEQTLGKLEVLFGTWFGGFGWDDVEDLLVPQFSLTVTQIPLALAFPRKWLVPLDAQSQPKPEPATSKLTFNVGSVTYSTRTGLTFEGENTFGFEKSAIGKTGLTLEIAGARVDFSRTTNIPEADAAGYPVDFVGVYVKAIEIGLPEKWFAKDQVSSTSTATLGIVGRDLLIGTGGVTGTIGLEALDTSAKPKTDADRNTAGAELKFVLGKQPDSGVRKGFALGFSAFDMTFRQNAVTGCKVVGSLTIPKVQTPNPIGIELYIGGDGDFHVTASLPSGYPISIPGVFTYKATMLEVGKDDDKVFLSTSGDLDFSGNPILGTLISKPIHLEKLCIHSDGSIEIEGGTVKLPESVSLKIGPAKIAITALHMGAHEQEHGGVQRKYRYVGFDGGISLNPGGVDARGDGITFYHTVDDDSAAGREPHRYLAIQGIGIDLVIPGSASKEQAALLLSGYLALKDPVYMGSISFELPKAKIAGGASMMYNTHYPAWIVDANLSLPKPLPLGATSLGIYSFRGLFGWRYIASKEAVTPALAADATWGDYYRAPTRGVNIAKFKTPDDTGGAKNPFSVGVGVGLCTESDGGKIFSAQLFLLVSLPNLIMLDGRADILAKKRVDVMDDPPFYAYLAISPESVELGAGAHYLIPKDTGTVLTLDASLEAAFFFHNSSAWYVHFGTKDKPVTARIVSMFDGYSYLMLSASGVEAGAGVHYDFAKSYGPIGVSAHAYLDLWAHIAFERFQAGGGIALGGSVDVRLFRFELFISIAAGLTVEVPKPFRIAGSVEVCVTVKLIKTFSKCCTLEFVWDRDQGADTSAVDVIAPPAATPAATAVHMLSGSTYAVDFTADPAYAATPPAIPLDCYIDIKLTKPVDPGAVAGRIGGFTNPPDRNVETMPPAYGSRIIDHSYALKSVKIEVRSGSSWQEYKPYSALAAGAVLDADTAAQLDALPLGMWQKQDAGYSQIRFLALTPFSWMGPSTGFTPEEMGLTAKTVYCVSRARAERCLTWPAPQFLAEGRNYFGRDVLYRGDGALTEAVATTHDRLAPVSLAIAPLGRATFRFLLPAVHCRIVAFTTAPAITVRWQRRASPQPPTVDAAGTLLPWPDIVFEDIGPPLVVPRTALSVDIVYDDPEHPIERVVIETPGADPAMLQSLEEQIAQRTEDLVRADAAGQGAIATEIAALKARLAEARDKTCIHDPDPGAAGCSDEIAKLKTALAAVDGRIAKLQKSFDASCRAPTLSGGDCAKLSAEIAALDAQAKDLQSQLDGVRSQIDAKQQTYDNSCVVTASGAPPSAAAPGTPPRATAGAPRAIAAVAPQADAPAAQPTSCLGLFINVLVKLAAAVSPPAPVPLPPPAPAPPPGMTAQDCAKLAEQIAALQAQAKDLADQIAQLEQQGAALTLPDGWACGTFVHEICWLAQEDYAFNQSIPGIDAIAADYSTMRQAAEQVIQPIWQPWQTYRIALTVADSVTDRHNGTDPVEHVHAPYYAYFRTEGPIGYFSQIAAPDFGVPTGPNNDDRVLAPERAIKFYIDEPRSYPDPSGNTLYAKPLYYGAVTLRLFFNRPYAYHFFSDWNYASTGPTSYALDLAIKDPAETAPSSSAVPDYQAALVPAALSGTQDWVADAAPRVTPELAAINALSQPLAPGESHATACLAIGGDPIVPASKALKVTVNDLKPDKLYTAVMLNRTVADGSKAEIGSYGFTTSHYRSFAEHIASLRLRDDDGNTRLAVFTVAHDLAPSAGEGAAVAAALAIVARAPGPASEAYPDAFDRLIHEQLKLAPLAPPASLEVNFVANSETGTVFALWLRSPEALFDPRLPQAETAGLLTLLQAGNARADARILFSKDACQAFVMSAGGSPPLHNVSFAFANKIWNGSGYDVETALSETFARP